MLGQVPTAQAQPQETNGFRIGEGRLHPYLQLDSRFTVNPGRATSSSPKNHNDLVLVVRPGLEFDLPSDTFQLKFSGDGEYRGFVGVGDPVTRNLSDFMAEAGFEAVINKAGAYSFTITDTFVRSADPANEGVFARFLHNSNNAGLLFTAKPGGGALVIETRYNFFFDLYDQDSSGDNREMDNFQHRPRLKLSWSFLPKTELFLEGEGTFTSYPDATTSVDTSILQVYLGAMGNITAKLSAILQAGYGQTFSSSTDNFQNAIGQAELRYAFTETAKWSLGYTRSVQPTSLFAYIGSDKIYTRFDILLGGRVNLATRIDYSFLGYGTGPGGERSDGLLMGTLDLDIFILDWLILTIGDEMELRTSSTSGPGSSYFFNDVFLRVTARY